MPSQSHRLTEDYEITRHILNSDLKMASVVSLVFMSILGIIGTIAILYFYIDTLFASISIYRRLLYAILLSISIYLLGAIGGLFWQKTGMWIAANTYQVYLGQFQPKILNIFGKIYMQFVGDKKVIFIEGQAIDPNFQNILYRIKFILRIGISQLSFFIIGWTFISNPLYNFFDGFKNSELLYEFNREIQILLSIGLAVVVVAIYLPGSFIIKDSNIRTWDVEKRVINQPLSTIRGRIDSLIGIGALLSGWEFYLEFAKGEMIVLNKLLGDMQSSPLLTIIDYFLLLIVIIFLSSPIIYPAAVTYNFKHQQNVNTFRANAIQAGVSVGISKIRSPNHREQEIIQSYVEKINSNNQ